jgi:hypothetical protein
MTTLSIDARHPRAAGAVEAFRRGDLEMQGIFRACPHLTMRVVNRAMLGHLDHVNRQMAKEQAI